MLRSNTQGGTFCPPMLFPVGLVVLSLAFLVVTCKSVSEIVYDGLFLVVIKNNDIYRGDLNSLNFSQPEVEGSVLR